MKNTKQNTKPVVKATVKVNKVKTESKSKPTVKATKSKASLPFATELTSGQFANTKGKQKQVVKRGAYATIWSFIKKAFKWLFK